jgi:diadenosine tetraphosphatase ApaH/serine/threonine PP2A family protein phosphatase
MGSIIQDIAKNIVVQIIASRIPGAGPFRPDLSEVDQLVSAAQAILQKEPGTLFLTQEHCVVGDIHGNIDVLLRILEIFHYPPERCYLFLGDYVDRGTNSCEVILMLYALKVRWPEHVQLIRGNHEFGAMTELYGFRRECQTRMSNDIYHKIVASFDSLPLAAILFRNFCVHGGISPSLRTAADVAHIPKDCAPFGDNLASDLLWSDPRIEVSEYESNPRGCGRLFGEEAVSTFTTQTGICDRVIRAHESCTNGFDWPFADPTVLTLFSSCDYCQMMNDAGVAIVSADGEPKCHALAPLLSRQMKRRRVTFPDWALCVDSAPVAPARELDDCLTVLIEV